VEGKKEKKKKRTKGEPMGALVSIRPTNEDTTYRHQMLTFPRGKGEKRRGKNDEGSTNHRRLSTRLL